MRHDHLPEPDAGQWVITTESSRYVLDLERGTAIRFPEDDSASELRRDSYPFIIADMTADIGEPMTLLANALNTDADVWTIRATTPVTSIVSITTDTTTDAQLAAALTALKTPHDAIRANLTTPAVA